MKIKNIIPLLAIFFCFNFFSCVSRSSYTLLYNMKQDSLYSVKYNELVKVKPQDRINIIVRSKNPVLSMPFNTPSGNVVIEKPNISIQEGNYGKNTTLNQQRNELRSSSGYIVDDEGKVTLPVLGKVYVSGLNLIEISHKIEKQIQEKGYIKDPMVETQFLEFRVYIINGNSGSVINVPNDRFNIIQAVAQGVNVDQSLRIDHVAVIRKDHEGKNRIYFNNLLNTNIFNSPTFYLEPGDIIYVQPRYQRAEAVDLDNVFKYTSYILTTVFTVTSILNIFNK